MLDKDSFRKASLCALKYAQTRMHHQKDHRVIQKLYALVHAEDARTIMLYIPLKIEVDIYPLIKLLRQQQRQLYVPFMEGESFSLVKYRLPLERKQFGIKEPKYSKQYRVKNIDLAIIPIVGTDPTLRRVGFGKGMYDRFFEREQRNIKKTVFISRQLCLSRHVVTDYYDSMGDIVITPKKILYKKSSRRI